MVTPRDPLTPASPYQPRSADRLQDQILGRQQRNPGLQRVQDKIVARRALRDHAEEPRPILELDNDKPAIPEEKTADLTAEEERGDGLLGKVAPALNAYDRNVDKPLVGLTTGIAAAALAPLNLVDVGIRYATGSGERDPNSKSFSTLTERYFGNLAKNVTENVQNIDSDTITGDVYGIWLAIGEAYQDTDLPKYTKGLVEIINPIDPLNLIPVAKFGRPALNLAKNAARAHVRGVASIGKNTVRFVNGTPSDVIGDAAPRVVQMHDVIDNDYSLEAVGGIVNRMTWEEAQGFRQHAGALWGTFITLPGISNLGRAIVPTWYMKDPMGRAVLKSVNNIQKIDSVTAQLDAHHRVGRLFDNETGAEIGRADTYGKVGSGAIFELDDFRSVANLDQSSLFYRNAVAKNELHKLKEVYLFENFLVDDELKAMLSKSQLEKFHDLYNQMIDAREILKAAGAPKEILEKLDHYIPRYIKEGEDIAGISETDDIIAHLSNPITGGSLDPVFGKPRRGTLLGNLQAGAEYHDAVDNIKIFNAAVLRYVNATNLKQNIGKFASRDLYLETEVERTLVNLINETDGVINSIDEGLLDAINNLDDAQVDAIITKATERFGELDELFAEQGKKTKFGKSTKSARKALVDILGMKDDIPPMVVIAESMGSILSNGQLMSGLANSAFSRHLNNFGTTRMRAIARELQQLQQEDFDRIIARNELLEKYGGRYTLDDDGLKEAIDEIGLELSSARTSRNNLNKEIRKLEKGLKAQRAQAAKYRRTIRNYENRPKEYRSEVLASRGRENVESARRNLETAENEIRGTTDILRANRRTRASVNRTIGVTSRQRNRLRGVVETKTTRRNAVLRRYGGRYTYDSDGRDFLMDDLRREYMTEFQSILTPTAKPRSLKGALKIAGRRVKDKESDELYQRILQRKGVSEARRDEMKAIKERHNQARNLKRQKTGDTLANQRLASDLLLDVNKRRDALKASLLEENPNANLGGYGWFTKSTLDQFDANFLDSVSDDLLTVNTGGFDDFSTMLKQLSKSLDARPDVKLGMNKPLIGLRKAIKDGWDASRGRPVNVKAQRVRAALKKTADSRAKLDELRDPLQKKLDEIERIVRKSKKDRARIIEDPKLGKLYGLNEDRVPGFAYLEDRLQYVFGERKTIEKIHGLLSAPDNALTTFGRVGASVSATIRVLMTAFDFGVYGIHSFLQLANDPYAFAQGVRGSIRAIANPSSYHRFVNQEAKTIQEMIAGGWSMDTASLQEYAAFAPGRTDELAGGKGVFGAIGDKFYLAADDVEKAGGKKHTFLKTGGHAARIAEQGAGKLVSRFQVFFNANRTYMSVHMYKNMKETWIRSGGEISDLMDFINKATGFYDSASAGIGIQQQAMERAFLFFAPRYTRASLALAMDMFRGGLKGDAARQAIFAQMSILPIYYGSVALMLGQEPKLDPRPRSQGGDGAQFLTLEIGGRNIGLGSIWVALTRLAADVISTPVEEMTRVVNPAEFKKNPFLRFIMGRNAPTTQLMLRVLQGETFLGEPLESAGDWAKLAGSNAMPFWAETLLLEGGDTGGFFNRMLGASTEFLGTRQYPLSLSEQLAKAREEGAREMYGQGETAYPSWNDLNLLQREKVQNNPRYNIQGIRERMSDRFQSDDFDKLNNVYWGIYNDAGDKFIKRVNDGIVNVDMGIWDIPEFKERVLQWNRDKSIERNALESEEFAEVHESLRESFNSPDRDLPAEDVAYQQYMTDIVFNDDLHLDGGNYDFELREFLEAKFVAEWGDEVFQYVQNIAQERAATPDYGYPQPLREFYHGRRQYAFYWDASDAAVIQTSDSPDSLKQRINDYRVAVLTDKQNMLENDQELRDAINRIERIRRLFREKDRGLDIYVHRWYGTNLVHRDNQWDTEDYYRTELNIDFPYPQWQELP